MTKYQDSISQFLSVAVLQIIPNQEQVKLTNIGESRKADLPHCLSYEAGDYVYLPPEVITHYRCLLL